MANDQYNPFDSQPLLRPTFSSSKRTRNILERARSCRAGVGVDRTLGMLGRETLQRKTVSWDLPDFFGLGVNATSQRSVDSPLENSHEPVSSKIVANQRLGVIIRERASF